MARIKKYGTKLDLARYNTFITDTDPSSLYLKITEFNDVFSGGKNGFVIEGTEYLQNGTEVKIEVTDVNGEPLYSEPGDGIPEYYEGIAKVVSVHVYDDIPIGEGNITILAELKEYTDATGDTIPIPDEWKGVYNLKWQRRFTINKNFPNEDKVRFYFRPTVDVEEIVKPIFNIEVPLITQSGSAEGIPQLPIAGTYLDSYLGGTLYRIRTTDGSRWTGSIEGNEISFPSLGYTANVVEVLSDTDLLVKEPYTFRLGNFNVVSPFTASQYQSTFEYFENETIDTSNTLSSFGKFTIRRLATFVGDVARVKVFRKSRSLLESFQLIQDIKLESTELLTDFTATGSNEVYYGNFYGTHLYDYWTSGSDDHPITLNNSTLLNSIRIDYDSSIGGIQQLQTNDEFQFDEGSEYTLSFRLLYTGGASDTAYIKAYISGSSYREEITNLTYSPTYKSKQDISTNFIPTTTGTGKLVLEIVGDTTNTINPSPEWYIAQLSLRAAQDTAFSPDEITFIQQVPRKLFNETFDFKFEFYDINNNYIPVDVQRTKQFTGGNDISGQITELSLSTNKTVFTFTSGGIADPLVQTDIQFNVSRNGYSGSTTWYSSAFDSNGSLLVDGDYPGGQYPGLLSNISDFTASLSVGNFTGSRSDIRVSSIEYRVEVEGDSAITTVFGIVGGRDGDPGITVIPTIESFTLPANSIGTIQVPLNNQTGSITVRSGTDVVPFDNTLADGTFRYSVTGTNVTPVSANPTVNEYGITAMSSDNGSLTLNVEYKTPSGITTNVQRSVQYNKSKINAPQLSAEIAPKTISVTAANDGVQVGTLPTVNVKASELYTGSAQYRTLTFLSSSATGLSAAPSFNAGAGTISFGSVTLNQSCTNTVLNVTACAQDSEGTTRSIIDTISISKVNAGTDGANGCNGCDPGVFYQGCWDNDKCYYHNDIRRDVVSWGNCYWQTNCTQLNSCCGYWWQEPEAANERWRSFGCTLQSVATDILFAQDVYANRTVNIGMSGSAIPVIALNSDFPNAGANPSIRFAGASFGGNGIFIGYNSGIPKVSFKSVDSCLVWDGTDLYATGTINASSVLAGYISGSHIEASCLLAGYISGTCICATNIHGGSITSTYLNSTTICTANLCASNFRGGTICATILSGSFVAGGCMSATYISGSRIQGGCIHGNCIHGSYICGGCIHGNWICGGCVTAGYISGSFIQGGCVVAGYISGSVLCAGRFYDGFICGTCLKLTGNGAGERFTVDSNGLYMGDDDFVSAPFRVNLAGDLNATSATISGFLSACEILIPNGDYWKNDNSFMLGGATGICKTAGGNVYIGGDTIIAGSVTANSVIIGSDYWCSNNCFQLGGSTGIIYDGGTVTIGSAVVVNAPVTATKFSIDDSNYWCVDKFRLGGDAGICFDGTTLNIGSSVKVKGDISTSGDDYWCQNNAFRFGGANGITYGGSGKIVLGSDTCIKGILEATTGTIGGWHIGDTFLCGNGMCLINTGIIRTTATPGDGNAGFSVCSNRLYLGAATNKYIDVSTDKIDLNFNTARVNLISTGAEIFGNAVTINSCTGVIVLAACTNLNMSAGTVSNVDISNSQNFIVTVGGNINFTTGTGVGTEGFVVIAPNWCMGTDGNLCLLDSGEATDWVARSDYRLKNFIQPHRYGLCDVMKLNPVSYTLKSDKCERNRIGFIAQCVREIIPEVVYGDAMLGIEYSKMVSVLTSAIQQQQCQIEELRREMCCLRKG